MAKFGKQDDGSWIIRADRVGELMARAAKVIRRAGKTGTGTVSVETLDRGVLRRMETLEGGRDVERVIPWVRVRISGEAPVIGGFRFVARVEHHTLEGVDGSRHWANIISKAPGVSEDVPARYRSAAPVCEHCETNRRRNDTFLLRSEFGTVHQIGRNCLADFVRSEDVADALGLWRLLSQLECVIGDAGEDSDLGGSGHGYTGTLRYLATVCAVIRKDGWLSKSAAIEQGRGMAATAVVADVLCGKGFQPDDQDTELAGEVIGWAQGLGEREDLSDYLHNVRTAVALGYVDGRHTGIVASAVVAYQREMEQEVKRALKAARGPGEHVGTVGKRTALAGLTVTRKRVMDGHYGPKTVLAFEDVAGNELVWFASGIPGLQVGDVVGGKATVKEHGQYAGRAQTVLTRCAFAATSNTVAA